MEQTDSMAAALLELARDWGISLADFSGPVSEEEIDAAQRDLGVVLPASYRGFLHYFGAGCLHHYEIYLIPIDRLWGDVVTQNRRPLQAEASGEVHWGCRRLFLLSRYVADEAGRRMSRDCFGAGRRAERISGRRKFPGLSLPGAGGCNLNGPAPW